MIRRTGLWFSKFECQLQSLIKNATTPDNPPLTALG